jgi:hypothetical protein
LVVEEQAETDDHGRAGDNDDNDGTDHPLGHESRLHVFHYA